MFTSNINFKQYSKKQEYSKYETQSASNMILWNLQKYCLAILGVVAGVAGALGTLVHWTRIVLLPSGGGRRSGVPSPLRWLSVPRARAGGNQRGRLA